MVPGPGYYSPKEGKNNKGFSFNSPAEMRKAKNKSNLSLSPKSPRMTPVTAQMRDDVLFYSTGYRQELDSGGPGYYFKNDCGLLKKSFNVRASQKIPIKSSGSSPNRIKKSEPPFSSAGFPVSPIKRTQTTFVTPVHH